jgi:hypothetical protein
VSATSESTNAGQLLPDGDMKQAEILLEKWRTDGVLSASETFQLLWATRILEAQKALGMTNKEHERLHSTFDVK